MTVRDDGELLALLLRLGAAHVKRAEEALAWLRGKGRGQFIADKAERIEQFKQRLTKAITMKASEAVLDQMHGLMRDIEALHDSVIAAATGHEVELQRWMETAGLAS